MVALAGCLADVRPPPLDDRPVALDEAAGRAVLERAHDAQHLEGSVPWAQLPGAEVTLTDAFFGLSGWIYGPWPRDPQRLTLRFQPAGDRGVARFVDDDGVEQRWGLHAWNAWTQTADGPVVYDDHDDVLFWLPTVEYFLEAAFRLREAAIVDLGEPYVDIEGRRYDRAYATWVSYEPNAQVDQFVAYVSQASGLLTRLDFTARDVFGFVVGSARYSDFRQVDGYVLPPRVEIEVSPTGGVLHVYEVERWRPGVLVTADEIAPEDKPPKSKP